MNRFDDDYGRDYDPVTGWVNENPVSHWREPLGSYGGGSSHGDNDPKENEQPRPSWRQRLFRKIRSFFE